MGTCLPFRKQTDNNNNKKKTTAKPRTFQRRTHGSLLPGDSKEQGCYNVVPEVVTMTTDDRQSLDFYFSLFDQEKESDLEIRRFQ